MNRQQWLEERKKGICGTDISAILGLNPRKTAYQMYLEKLGLAEPTEETMAMKLGKKFEPIVAELYEEATNRKLKECELLVHPMYEFIRGTPDRMVCDEDLGLEIKTLRSFDAGKSSETQWGDEHTDQIPQHYFLQVIWYMLLTGRSAFDVAALAGGQEFRIYRVNKDQELEKMLIDKADAFWHKNVLQAKPPEISVNDDLPKIYNKVLIGAVIATDEICEICEELAKVDKEEKEAKAKKEEMKAIVQLYMKEKDILIDTSGKTLVTWKGSEVSRLDSKRLKASGIDISAFYNTNVERKFLIK